MPGMSSLAVGVPGLRTIDRCAARLAHVCCTFSGLQRTIRDRTMGDVTGESRACRRVFRSRLVVLAAFEVRESPQAPTQSRGLAMCCATVACARECGVGWLSPADTSRRLAASNGSLTLCGGTVTFTAESSRSVCDGGVRPASSDRRVDLAAPLPVPSATDLADLLAKTLSISAAKHFQPHLFSCQRSPCASNFRAVDLYGVFLRSLYTGTDCAIVINVRAARENGGQSTAAHGGSILLDCV